MALILAVKFFYKIIDKDILDFVTSMNKIRFAG